MYAVLVKKGRLHHEGAQIASGKALLFDAIKGLAFLKKTLIRTFIYVQDLSI
jgi:hypothetical protein